MEYSLTDKIKIVKLTREVLMLVLMEYSLTKIVEVVKNSQWCLNPCSNGMLSDIEKVIKKTQIC